MLREIVSRRTEADEDENYEHLEEISALDVRSPAILSDQY